ncbi:MAG: response regulator transcription factor [Peptococcaceae bacterium]|nr:response regulator transcription factor [Peptococcaceae bacterium]
MVKILLIEDEVAIQELIRFNLEKEGYKVLAAGDGQEGLNMARNEKPDLIVLDLMLPKLDGYEVCKALRADKATAKFPIIILSARNEIVDKVIGLELGADDYINKPFSPKELVARIKARLREQKRHDQNSTAQTVLTFAELEVWPDNYIVTLAGKPLNLTTKEFELLYLLITNPNRVFSREHLLQKVWDYGATGDTRTVDVHVSNLRHKLQHMGRTIETVRGVGYRFAAGN